MMTVRGAADAPAQEAAMKCTFCGMTGADWRHRRDCEQNPENAPDVMVTYPCGHNEGRKPFPNDTDGSKLAAFVQERELCSGCFIAEYRAAQARRTPDQIVEHAYELRAAFGPGVEVINVITGETTRT